MKRKQNTLTGIMAGIGFLILILDSSLALEGARDGINLCLKTVIPSLFPFFVLSMVLTNGLKDLDSYPVKVISGILGIPKAASSVLIPAVLAGYPVGAKCVGDLYQSRQISGKEAERMLAFCSNAGPSFLFGMVSGFFPEKKTILLLWMILLLSGSLTALSLPPVNADVPYQKPAERAPENALLMSAARAMAAVCCWVVLFRVVIAFLDAWFFRMLPQWLQVLLMGFLELTNGCWALPQIADVRLRFVLCACILSFGGICVLFQTKSVTKGLSLRWYLLGKLLQTLYSLLLSAAFIGKQWWIAAAVIPVPVILLKKRKFPMEIPGLFLYNKKRNLPEA